jgi:hypothetical protein
MLVGSIRKKSSCITQGRFRGRFKILVCDRRDGESLSVTD